jgi:adenosylcobinamide-GDP ribazoletransferase
MVAAGAGIALVCGWRFHARAGGITGDFLGATEQVCECAVLLVLAL